jgi:hypothetical protein
MFPEKGEFEYWLENRENHTRKQDLIFTLLPLHQQHLLE